MKLEIKCTYTLLEIGRFPFFTWNCFSGCCSWNIQLP